MPKKEKYIWKGLLAAALVLCMIFGLVSYMAPVTAGAAVERVSDEETTGSYQTWLGGNHSTRYNGRVWTDKTIYTEDASFTGDVGSETIQNDSDFLVSF